MLLNALHSREPARTTRAVTTLEGQARTRHKQWGSPWFNKGCQQKGADRTGHFRHVRYRCKNQSIAAARTQTSFGARQWRRDNDNSSTPEQWACKPTESPLTFCTHASSCNTLLSTPKPCQQQGVSIIQAKLILPPQLHILFSIPFWCRGMGHPTMPFHQRSNRRSSHIARHKHA